MLKAQTIVPWAHKHTTIHNVITSQQWREVRSIYINIQSLGFNTRSGKTAIPCPRRVGQRPHLNIACTHTDMSTCIQMNMGARTAKRGYAQTHRHEHMYTHEHGGTHCETWICTDTRTKRGYAQTHARNVDMRTRA